MTPEQRAEFERWIKTRPPHIQAAARQVPPATCYRIVGDGHGHYMPLAYGEPEKEGDPVTVRVAHGADSFAPGFEVFGVALDSLVPCDCGEWRWPTAEEAEEGREYADKLFASIKAKKRAAH